MEEMKTQTIGGKTFEIVDAKAREDLANLRKEGLGGEPGATFTPAVSEDGTLSWTNDRELANPAPVNIMGPQGGPGPVGPAPVKGVDYWTPEDQAAIEDYLDNAMAERAGLMVNFSVKAYASEEELQAATPASNTIGVVTDTAISKSVLAPTEPDNPPAGMVWIKTAATGKEIATLAAAGLEFGMVYVISAYQYIADAWAKLTAKSYQGGVWVGWARLPDEYQEVEYIQTTGTQWIDTGIIPTENVYQVSTKVVTTVTEQNIILLGTGSNPYYHLTPYANKWYIGQSGGEGGFGSYPATVGAEYEIDFNNADHAVIINGVVLCSGKTYTSGASIKMARRATMSSASGGKFKYYYFRVVNNSTSQVLMDLVPCYRRADSVAGMYDLVGGRFFTNAGTGTFIVGGDV